MEKGGVYSDTREKVVLLTEMEKLGVTVMGADAPIYTGSMPGLLAKVPKLLPRVLTSTASMVALGASRVYLMTTGVMLDLISAFLPRVLRSIGVAAAATMPIRSMVAKIAIKIIFMDNVTSLFL
jgi:hypothetical protein